MTQFSGEGGGGPVFGYLDDRGRVAIPPAFSEAQPFRDGTAVVHRNQKCGVIDRNGRERLPIEFDHCNRLPDGRVVAAVEAPFDPEKWARALELEREPGD